VCLVTYFVVVSGFIVQKEKNQRIQSLRICITDSTKNQFLKTSDIRKILNRIRFSPLGKSCAEINLESIEVSLLTHQAISAADAYFTEPGSLHIEIRQKTPFVRVFNRYGQGYYLDRQGNIIPLSRNYSPYILVASGFIAEPFVVGQSANMRGFAYDSINRSMQTIYDVFHVADFITSDKFWNAQIEQVYVNDRYEIELIPRIGSHIILLGNADHLKEKLENLSLLYRKGFNLTGWNQYEKINLKYKNQVVCTKKQ
jgi:cell division protein FtsQ